MSSPWQNRGALPTLKVAGRCLLGYERGPLHHVCRSLLPVGLAQTWASVEKGYWYARSTEFLGLPYMQTLRWMRVPGDTIFAIAAFVLVAFVFAGRSGSARRSEDPVPDAVRVPAGD